MSLLAITTKFYISFFSFSKRRNWVYLEGPLKGSGFYWSELPVLKGTEIQIVHFQIMTFQECTSLKLPSSLLLLNPYLQNSSLSGKRKL